MIHSRAERAEQRSELRNARTLTYGSIILTDVGVQGYKTDPSDDTIGTNACVIRPMNALGPRIRAVVM